MERSWVDVLSQTSQDHLPLVAPMAPQPSVFDNGSAVCVVINNECLGALYSFARSILQKSGPYQRLTVKV